MIINPIYLNSKNSEENDWNPYVMEEDKMLDLSNYSVIELIDHSNKSYSLYDRQNNRNVKMNSNTTIILGNLYNNKVTIQFAGTISDHYQQNDGTALLTSKILIKSDEYFKIKLPSNFIGRYLSIVIQDAGISLTTLMSCFVHDYDA